MTESASFEAAWGKIDIYIEIICQELLQHIYLN